MARTCMIALVAVLSLSGGAAGAESAGAILEKTGVKGGLVVHIGCGNGKLTAALHAGDSYLVQGLDTDAHNVDLARRYIKSLGIYGKVSVEKFDGERLPYIDNLVNLVVCEDLGDVPISEVMRVLCPGGIAYIRQADGWTKKAKARPGQIDEWTHYLHDATNNAVAHDTVVGPPRRMQWIGSPRWARHHDRLSSVSAVVSAGGRVFYIFDEGSRFSVLLEPRWSLIARDAFNGTILWKKPIGKWHTHLWPLKSGPAQLPRRLVAAAERVYVTLGIDSPLSILDAATGKVVRTIDETRATEEVILSDGVLFALVDTHPEQTPPQQSKRNPYGGKFWDERPRKLTALRADSGEVLWAVEGRVVPVTLAADGKGVYFHDGSGIVCLDRRNGKELWRSEPVPLAKEIRAFYAPTLVLYEDVVLFSGGETAGLQTGSWYTSGKDTMTALSARTGKILWSAYHPPSGYRSAEDLLVVNGLVWTGETTSGRAVGVFTGRDPHTGQVKAEFTPDVKVYWFHHRCYRGKATDNYLLMSRAGTEFIDIRTHKWVPNHWVRGACLYGVMPANGLIYNPPHPCACYLETKLNGFNALAPASKGPRVPKSAFMRNRLEKGPAYRRPISGQTRTADWPTYRHDTGRSGNASTTVPTSLGLVWQKRIAGKLTSPVAAGERVFVASVDTHTVHAMEAASGKKLWSFTAGARVDSVPTIYRGRAVFGSRDGYVYCLDVSDGALVWRFQAAPADERLTSFEQVESVWPVNGSVLVRDGVVYCVAGRSMFLDGGLHLWRLDAETGRALSHTEMTDRDETGKDLHEYVNWLNMAPGLPDILSTDGRLLYMRSQPFTLDGRRLPLEKPPAGKDADAGAPAPRVRADRVHLFCPTGFLDDSWWHRTYWLYGSDFISGWCGYFLAGKVAPAGRILVYDDMGVYGFGRKPQYYRWTTPIEHHLFAAKKPGAPDDVDEPDNKPSVIRIEKSASLNPAGKAVSVAAFIKPEGADGVVLARGGGAQGYVLFVRNGRPSFAVRTGGKAGSVTARGRIIGKWAHVTGVLTDDQELLIYLDGKLAASAKGPGMIGADPQEAMQIGDDEGSLVAEYGKSTAFKGLIDEVRVYHEALGSPQIEALAAGREPDARQLVLRYSFDKGKAVDESGNNNNGQIEGALADQGKLGRAMKFSGKAASVSGFRVEHKWTQDIPFFARAMVLAGDTLFLAGPPDIVDEPQVLPKIDEPQTARRLAEQAAALGGRRGSLLWAVSKSSGRKLGEYKLDGLPVFDGMIAADGRLYISTVDGRVVCMASKQ